MSIRFFDNVIQMALGYPPEACDQRGHCSILYVVEADGGVYPCDFYVNDTWYLGHVQKDSLAQLGQSPVAQRFVRSSLELLAPECRQCRWFGLCRGGCRRHKEPVQRGETSLSRLCPGYKLFFEYAEERIREIARQLSWRLVPGGSYLGSGTVKFKIITFGCQMNVHDSEKIAGYLTQCGHGATEDLDEADLVIFNTCCVRENPERKLYGQVGQLKGWKEKKPGRLIGVCGCMVQQEAELPLITERLPHVDLVFGTHNIHRLPELLQRCLSGERVIEVWDDSDGVYIHPTCGGSAQGLGGYHLRV